MQNFIFYKKENHLAYTKIRPGETKLGEKIQAINNEKRWRDESRSEDLPQMAITCRFGIFRKSLTFRVRIGRLVSRAVAAISKSAFCRRRVLASVPARSAILAETDMTEKAYRS